MTDTIVIQNHGDFSYEGELSVGDSAANELTGTATSDIIAGDKGNDIIEGGEGDDLLIGGELRLLTNGNNAGQYQTDGAGSDTFVFNFGLSHSTGTTYYFRPNEDGDGGDTPNQNANLSAWQNYMDQLEAWRGSMADKFGADADASSTGQALYTVKKSVGSLGSYDNSYTVGGDGWTIESHDGTDRILQWGEGDKLQLNGLSGLDLATFDDLFDVALNNEGDTVLTWDGGSITIDGMAITNVSEFYSAGAAGDWFA